MSTKFKPSDLNIIFYYLSDYNTYGDVFNYSVPMTMYEVFNHSHHGTVTDISEYIKDIIAYSTLELTESSTPKTIKERIFKECFFILESCYIQRSKSEEFNLDDSINYLEQFIANLNKKTTKINFESIPIDSLQTFVDAPYDGSRTSKKNKTRTDVPLFTHCYISHESRTVFNFKFDHTYQLHSLLAILRIGNFCKAETSTSNLFDKLIDLNESGYSSFMFNSLKDYVHIADYEFNPPSAKRSSIKSFFKTVIFILPKINSQTINNEYEPTNIISKKMFDFLNLLFQQYSDQQYHHQAFMEACFEYSEELDHLFYDELKHLKHTLNRQINLL